MKKTRTVGGKPAYGIIIKTCVTLSDFSTALCEEAYNNKGLDFDNLTKKKAKEILMHRLEWHGRNGEYDDPDGVGETQDEYNQYYNKARRWVLENYPYYLTNPQK